MKKPTSIVEEWHSYLNEVVPKNAGPAQLEETETAFYAGATSIFTMITNACHEEDESFHQLLTKLEEELAAFQKNLWEKAGRPTLP